jgi:hypothetical protein
LQSSAVALISVAIPRVVRATSTYCNTHPLIKRYFRPSRGRKCSIANCHPTARDSLRLRLSSHRTGRAQGKTPGAVATSGVLLDGAHQVLRALRAWDACAGARLGVRAHVGELLALALLLVVPRLLRIEDGLGQESLTAGGRRGRRGARTGTVWIAGRLRRRRATLGPAARGAAISSAPVEPPKGARGQ